MRETIKLNNFPLTDSKNGACQGIAQPIALRRLVVELESITTAS